jgi:hypothetical protein
MEEAQLSLREALATNRLEDFVKQAEAHGVALERGSEFERGLALLTVQRWRANERSCESFTKA